LLHGFSKSLCRAIIATSKVLHHYQQLKASKFGAKPVLRNLAPKIEVLSKRCEWFVLQERLQEPELNPRKKRGKEN
jgi:hypothetical protein